MGERNRHVTYAKVKCYMEKSETGRAGRGIRVKHAKKSGGGRCVESRMGESRLETLVSPEGVELHRVV